MRGFHTPSSGYRKGSVINWYTLPFLSILWLRRDRKKAIKTICTARNNEEKAGSEAGRYPPPGATHSSYQKKKTRQAFPGHGQKPYCCSGSFSRVSLLTMYYVIKGETSMNKFTSIFILLTGSFSVFFTQPKRTRACSNAEKSTCGGGNFLAKFYATAGIIHPLFCNRTPERIRPPVGRRPQLLPRAPKRRSPLTDPFLPPHFAPLRFLPRREFLLE